MASGGRAPLVGAPAMDFADYHALVQLYADYAYAVDSGDWSLWPEFFVDACSYRLVPRENHERGFPLATLSFESKGMLKDRVYGIKETLFHDPYYQRHVVGAPLVRSVEGGRITSEANYAVFRTKLNELSTVFNVGRYLDVVVPTPAGLKFESPGRRLRQRDDPELDHLSDLGTGSPANPAAQGLLALSSDTTADRRAPMQPVITSLLDTDLYKFTMWQAMLHRHPADAGRVHLRLPQHARPIRWPSCSARSIASSTRCAPCRSGRASSPTSPACASSARTSSTSCASSASSATSSPPASRPTARASRSSPAARRCT